jgi:cobalamin biosynthesis protein CobT
MQAEAATEHKRETIPHDVAAMTCFNKTMAKLNNGGGVSFFIDLTNDHEVMEMSNDTLMSIPVTDDDDDDDNEEDEDEEGNDDDDVDNDVDDDVDDDGVANDSG